MFLRGTLLHVSPLPFAWNRIEWRFMQYVFFQNPKYDRRTLRTLGWLAVGLGFLTVARPVVLEQWPEPWTILLPAVGLPGWMLLERMWRKARYEALSDRERSLIHRWMTPAAVGLYLFLSISVSIMVGMLFFDIGIELESWHVYGVIALMVLLPVWLLLSGWDDPRQGPTMNPIVVDLRLVTKFSMQVLSVILFASWIGRVMQDSKYTGQARNTIWTMAPWMVGWVLILIWGIGLIVHFYEQFKTKR
jgi:hypothetical protein